MKIDPPLANRLAKAGSSDEIDVIVTLENHEALAAVVRQTGIKTGTSYENIPSFSARLSAAKVRELAALPQVTQVELDSEAQAYREPPGR